MASPFPGMDPYLEAPALWPDVHGNLITEIQAVLGAQVRPKYFVGIERRVYILEEDDMAEEIEVQERFLAVRRLPGRELVAVIEILSPANRTPGSRGREEYLAKRRQTFRSSVHLVEIDLLRAGARIPSVDPLPSCDYLAHVSRTSLRPRGEVYAWGVREPPPTIPVPLGEGDPDAVLDLARAIRQVFDRVGYELIVDYDGPPPEPPLRAEDAAWADELLRSRSGS